MKLSRLLSINRTILTYPYPLKKAFNQGPFITSFSLSLILTILLLPSISNAQESKPQFFWVELKDKNQSPYSIWEPEQFLSPRAIERRNRQRIPITEEDLPVNPSYIQKVSNLGIKIHNRSKWLNALTVLADSTQLAKLMKLSFVKSADYVGKFIKKEVYPKVEKKRETLAPYQPMEDHYGHASQQIGVLKGDVLHMLGNEGEGMLIAILDGGFTNVDMMPFYDSLRMNHQIIRGYDFVDNDEVIYESSSHGTQVLSVMGANLPGLFVGTAPGASYICLKTEDVRAEYLTEECNWVAAAEYADSIGADVINSSLGYTGFTDKRLNYDKSELDGLHSRASRAGDIAFNKGMIVVNSAGNSGNDAWQTIGTPADGLNVLSIGAIQRDGEAARFSSKGPTADGRIKPEITAIGQLIGVASLYDYNVYLANGTSFSSPTVAGMVAALWSAFPDKSNREIVESILTSSSQFNQPDNIKGYGVPDFTKAYHLLKSGSTYEVTGRFHLIDNQLIIRNGVAGDIQLTFRSLDNIVLDQQLLNKTKDQRLSFELPLGLPSMSILEIEVGGEIYRVLYKNKHRKSLIRP